MRHRQTLLLLAVVVLCHWVGSFPVEAQMGSRRSVIIPPFENALGEITPFGRGVAQQLERLVGQTGAYEAVAWNDVPGSDGIDEATCLIGRQLARRHGLESVICGTVQELEGNEYRVQITVVAVDDGTEKTMRPIRASSPLDAAQSILIQLDIEEQG